MLEKICFPIKNELNELENRFKSIIETDVTLIKEIFNYIVASKGKRLRPMLLFLTCGLTGKPTAKAIDAAIIVELLHTATLIHDDVVDNSYLRRGNPSINSLWENKISVLIGDYLFASIFKNLVAMNDPRLIKIIAEVTTKMSQGELLQMEKANDFQINEETYLRLISLKTASLLAATCQIGALTAANSNGQHEKDLQKFGENLGIAFQIKDDLLDYYGSEENLGKPIGKDLIENIITLPVLHSLNQVNEHKREIIIASLKENNNGNAESIIEFVRRHGGIEYAEQKADFYIQQAMACLDSYPDSPYKESLMILANYITARNK